MAGKCGCCGSKDKGQSKDNQARDKAQQGGKAPVAKPQQAQVTKKV
ncbi:MAG: hypothetical protein BIFFINMI_03648 [Phycisphaerae bacterium]|nr:hypothetical protein [Phycisphaerae bacterium]